MKSLTRKQLANKIANILNNFDKEKFTATVWDKGEKMRIYVKDDGYTNARDRGFIYVTKDGYVGFEELKARTESIAIDLVKPFLEDIKIEEPTQLPGGVRRLTDSEVREEIANLEKEQEEAGAVSWNYKKSERALDAMYGRGGWDQRDLEDYEG